jgi:hypothetical protein
VVIEDGANNLIGSAVDVDVGRNTPWVNARLQ